MEGFSVSQYMLEDSAGLLNLVKCSLQNLYTPMVHPHSCCHSHLHDETSPGGCVSMYNFCLIDILITLLLVLLQLLIQVIHYHKSSVMSHNSQHSSTHCQPDYGFNQPEK